MPDEGPPIGIVAALPAEAAWLGRAGDPWIVISGMGQARAHEAALSLTARGAVALVSFGTAGALAPGLRAGDLVLADGVLSGSVLIESDRDWQGRLAGRLAGSLGVHTGTILHADAVVASPSDKSRLFLSTGAVAVDMESAGVARAAAEHDVPWLGVRAIVDAAGQSIPALALDPLGQDGRPRLGPLVAGLARAPSDLAPLLRLGLGFRAARVTLERLARLVGPGMGFSAGTARLAHQCPRAPRVAED
jgi:adenosylhomocysteine nucleosidase